MASGILGGGALTSQVQANAYTTPSGKTTTTSLLLSNSGTTGYVTLSLGPASITVKVPDGGVVTLSGIILAAGQGVSLIAYVPGINYLLTGWESTV